MYRTPTLARTALRPLLPSLVSLRLPAPLSPSSSAPTPPQIPRRAFHPTPSPNSGLTNLFDTPDLPSLSVTKLNDKGFILSDDLVVPGGVVFLGGRAMLWDVDPPLDPAKTGSKGLEGSWEGWEVERFKVFEVVVPRPGMF